MVAGHTKFAPDWCFGLLKWRYRRSEISCLDDLQRCIDQSSLIGVNRAQLTGKENGDVLVPTYDWQTMLSRYFRRLGGLKSYHHFSVQSDELGVVRVRKSSHSLEEKFNLHKTHPDDSMPEVLKPAGLSVSRQWYLYDNIRQFCSEQTRDIVCPLPQTPKGEPQMEAGLSGLQEQCVSQPPVVKTSKRSVTGKVGRKKVVSDKTPATKRGRKTKFLFCITPMLIPTCV